MTSSFESSFDYEGITYQVQWHNVTTKAGIPGLPWRQIYAVGNLDGLVPLVIYDRPTQPENLPGGTVEPGETIEECLARELEEELNARVVYWEPLGYQTVTDPHGMQTHQLRVYAKLEKIGEFENDPGGNVIGNSYVRIEDLNEHIKYGRVGERLIQLTKHHY